MATAVKYYIEKCKECKKNYYAADFDVKSDIKEVVCYNCFLDPERNRAIEKEKYADGLQSVESIRDNNDIQSIIISFVVYPLRYYHFQKQPPALERQLIFDDWIKYAKANGLKQSINTIKKVDVLKPQEYSEKSNDDFFGLLIKLQPWMHAQDVVDLMDFMKFNRLKFYGDRWKLFALIYFGLNWHELKDNEYIEFTIEMARDAGLQLHERIGDMYPSNLFGIHPFRIHVATSFMEAKCSPFKPPIVTLEQLKRAIKYQEYAQKIIMKWRMNN